MPSTHDHASNTRAKRQHGDHDNQEPTPGRFSLHASERYPAGNGIAAHRATPGACAQHGIAAHRATPGACAQHGIAAHRCPREARLSFAAMPMSGTDTVVMKFGGTSVADAERIKRAAGRIVRSKEAGTNVVAVLSARGKHTDELVSLANEVSDRPDPREMDMLLSTGERVTCALAAMVINDLGHEAISLTGSQAGIVTDSGHTKARIIEVRADRIRRGLEDGKIVLVAGFQGVSQDSYDVTTLGRGGSDTTAVALAAALGAHVCEIYTDVAGVFSADPRIVPEARKLPVLTFEEMLEMSASGAGVLQLRSVEYARNHGVSIHCRSSFDDGPGTVVQDEEQTMERPLVTAVTHSTAEARITLTGLPDEPGIAGRVLTALAEANINVDMIIQNEPQSEGHLADMSFTVPREDVATARASLEALQSELGFGGVQSDDRMGKVSIVGAGMKSHPGVAAKTFTVLGDAGVNIEMISTSPIKISCVVREEHVEEAVRKLHTAFELGADAVLPEDVAGVHRPKVA
jgi:aspartate kinase